MSVGAGETSGVEEAAEGLRHAGHRHQVLKQKIEKWQFCSVEGVMFDNSFFNNSFLFSSTLHLIYFESNCLKLTLFELNHGPN